MKDTVELQTIIANLEERIAKSGSQFDDWATFGDEWTDPSWVIEACFLQLLLALEALQLSDFCKIVYKDYKEIKNSDSGFSKMSRDPDGAPYSPVLGKLRRYILALKGILPADSHTVITRDLLDIIRNIHYVITDRDVFPNVPQNENDVHLRIEAILKCVFSDLKRKPTLSKQIKNFEPDTGIPSLRTLIEYKFLSRKSDVGTIADQLLADTRGYISKDWERFLYVIYETNRFKTELDWNQLMRESDVSANTTVVVLSGEPNESRHRVRKKILKKEQ